MSIGRHLRDIIRVDQDLIHRLQLDDITSSNGRGALFRFVGRTVVLGGGRLLSPQDIEIVADELLLDGAPVALEVKALPEPAFERVGREGSRIDVLAGEIRGRGDVLARGGRGGPGRKGKDGEIILVPIEGPPFPVGQPPVTKEQLPGEDGTVGGKGGRGGAVTVRFAADKTAGQPVTWQAPGGGGGTSGEGGQGQPDGVKPDDGPAGDPGTVSVTTVGRDQVLAALRRHIDEEGFLAEQSLHLRALHQFRLGNLDEFEKAARFVDEVFGGTPPAGGVRDVRSRDLATARRRRSEHRNAVGVAHDLDVVPVIGEFAAERRDAAQKLRGVLLQGGKLFTGFDRDRMGEAAARLSAHLGSLARREDGTVRPAGDLQAWAGDVTERLKGIEALRDSVDLGADSLREITIELLDGVAAGTISVPGAPNLTAGAVAAAIQALASGAVLHPALIDLAVHPQRATQGPFVAGSAEAQTVAQQALDLRHLDAWKGGVADLAGGAAVHLARIDDQLRTASGDLVARNLLRELLDLVQQRLHGDLRERQSLAELAEIDELARDARHWADLLGRYDDPVPPGPRPDLAFDLLDGIRVAGAVVTRAIHLDDRALLVRSGDLRPSRFEADRAETAAHAPDRIADIYEAPWDEPRDPLPDGSPPPVDPRIASALFALEQIDEALGDWLGQTNTSLRGEYRKRGIRLTDEDSRVTVTRTFRLGDGSGVVERLRVASSCWFDMGIDSLPSTNGAPRYYEVGAAGVSVRLVGAELRDEHVVQVRHSGRGWLRMLSGGHQPQRLGPATFGVAMVEGLGGEYGVAPTPTSEAFGLVGRALISPWMLSLPTPADVRRAGLTEIEVQFDVEGFVPTGTVSLRRVSHPTETIVPGVETKGTVELTADAPAGGLTISFTSTHPDLVAVQSAVTVPAGETSTTFTIFPLAVTDDAVPALTATAPDGSTARALIEISDAATQTIQRRSVVESARIAGVATLPGRAFVVAAPTAGSPEGAPSRAIALDGQFQAVARADLGVDARQVTADPTRNRLYVTNRGPQDAAVTMLDAATLEQLGRRPLGAGLHDVAVDPAAGLLYVSHWIARKVFVFDADDLSPVEEIGDPSFTGPLGLAVDPPTGRIFVARTYRAGEPNVEALSVIRRRPDGTHAVEQTIPLGTTVQPTDVAVDAPAGLVFVLGIGGGGVHPQVVVFDHKTVTEKGRVRVGGTPMAVTAQPGTGVAHVAIGSGVHVVDGHRLRLAALVPGPAAQCVASGDQDRIVSGAADGGFLQVKAPKALTLTEWR